MSVVEPTFSVEIPMRIMAAVEELIARCNENYTGPITTHLQDGIARKVEYPIKKSLVRSSSTHGSG